MEGATIIAIISVSTTALTAIITALFHSMSLSRCTNIDCCGIKCERNVLTEDTYKTEQKETRENNNNI
jgi:hypothetical protein|tara:strand:+ start:2706 stop:2909 length:204 start_codon:yes stop_codon:yes gene_type:complete